MELRFEVVGDVQLSRNLRIFADRMDNLADFFDEGLGIIEARSDEIFAARGANVEKAGTWPPLAQSTLNARTNRWGYYKNTPNRPGILRWTGFMQQSRSKRVTNDFGEFAFTDPKAIYHQKPTTDGHPPQRVIIDLSELTNQLIVKALQGKVHREMGIFGRQA